MLRKHPGAIALWIALSCLLAPSAFAGDARTRLVVFGDSLSDPGNFYAAFGLTSVAPYSPIPAAPYDIRGHRFTNGKTWIEQLADTLCAPDGGRPALLRPGVYTNYSVGGARARPGAADFPYFDLTTQVNLFLSDFHGQAPPRATYVVWIGGNDLRDALIALYSDPTGATSNEIITTAVKSVGDDLVALRAAGAKSFLVLNAPDLSISPAIQALGMQAIGATSQLTAAYNQGLTQVIAQVKSLTGARISTFDDFALLDNIVARPAAFHLDEVMEPCLAFGVLIDAMCDKPADYLFWDALHPTAAGHAIVARGAMRTLVADKLVTN